MIDVTSVAINEEANEVIIKGVDLDSIWMFHDEPEEDAECTEVAYKFDISLAGARKYLYLVTKNNKKANEFKFMDQRLEALVGQTIHFSNLKEELPRLGEVVGEYINTSSSIIRLANEIIKIIG